VARRSIGTPLTIGIVLAVLVLALAVGWQVLVWSGPAPLREGMRTLDWVLLVLGTLFFVLVMIGLVWMCAWLVSEMRLNQRQRAFLDAVTHEMKTPLASFRLYLDTLGRHDPAPERRREFLENMREDLDRLDRTVDQVLAAARAEEHAGAPRRQRVDLVKLLRGCIAEVRERQRLADEAFHLKVQSAPPVRGDPGELELVFHNLLENAVKYSDEPVDVRVGVDSTLDGRVQVEIADSGIGIPHGELRKIFQRFYRAGRDVQRKAAGLGLGLFIVRSLVKRQGGRVVALSEGAGQGSRFVVTLRVATPMV
jgi:signal transduction histidine kinase